MKIGKYNRLQKKKSKGGIYWCYGCDRQLVGDVKKCPICGYRNGHGRKNKKDNGFTFQMFS